MIQLIPSIHKLNKLTLKRIFDKKNMTYQEEKELDEGIELQMRRRFMPAYDRRSLLNIVNALIRNERGEFIKVKEAIAKSGLPYDVFFRDGNVS